MKTSAIVCAVLAGTFGLGSVASAQTAFHRDRDDRDQRVEQHRGDRRDFRQDQRRDGYRQGWQAQQHYNQPRYVYQQPRYVYQQPAYRAPQRFFRGGYLPHQYRQPVYYVNNWHAYPSLYAPPYGYQWMNVDGDFLLVALATGLIANALLN